MTFRQANALNSIIRRIRCVESEGKCESERFTYYPRHHFRRARPFCETGSPLLETAQGTNLQHGKFKRIRSRSSSSQAVASGGQNDSDQPTICVSIIFRRWRRSYLCGAGILFLVPLIFWTGPFGGRMSLGGDASLLFFEYPWTYLVHSMGVMGNNLTGYNPQVQYVPFLAVLTVLKILDLNVEGIVLGLVLSFAFTGAVRLVATLSGSTNEEVPPQAFLAGAIYVCAPILASIEWTTLLPRVMWLALTPWLIVLVIRHQREGGIRIPVLVGMILAVKECKK